MDLRDREVSLPVTEAELDEWEASARRAEDGMREPMLRLIAEVRRWRASGRLQAGTAAATDEVQTTDQNVEIVRDPEVCGGAPTFAGTRIGVHDVVSYAQIYGGDLERVREEALPYLSKEQIQAGMDWYREHPQEIDEILKRRREYYQQRLAESQAGR